MSRAPASPVVAVTAACTASGVGDVNTAPGTAAASMPRPTNPPCSGSCPDPPPGMTATFPATGAPARTTTSGSSWTRRMSACAAARPRSDSTTTFAGSLMIFFTATSGTSAGGGSPSSLSARRAARSGLGELRDHVLRDGDRLAARVVGVRLGVVVLVVHLGQFDVVALPRPVLPLHRAPRRARAALLLERRDAVAEVHLGVTVPGDRRQSRQELDGHGRVGAVALPLAGVQARRRGLRRRHGGGDRRGVGHGARGGGPPGGGRGRPGRGSAGCPPASSTSPASCAASARWRP